MIDNKRQILPHLYCWCINASNTIIHKQSFVKKALYRSRALHFILVNVKCNEVTLLQFQYTYQTSVSYTCNFFHCDHACFEQSEFLKKLVFVSDAQIFFLHATLFLHSSTCFLRRRSKLNAANDDCRVSGRFRFLIVSVA